MNIRTRNGVTASAVAVLLVVVVARPYGWFGTVAASAAADGSAVVITRLGELVVQPRGSMAGYSRDRFPHWSTGPGECDTSETVLKRDGTNVQTDARCRAVSGRWYSPYDGVTGTTPLDLAVDHRVPLADAWRSGASEWTDQRRTEFANDLTHHALVVVTGTVNQSKGDQAPDQWKPPLQSDWCTYATHWIEVKHAYRLSITEAEKTALTDLLGHC